MNKLYFRFTVLLCFTLLVSGLVIYITVDMHTFQHLMHFHPWSLVLALLILGIGMIFDGSRLIRLVRLSNEKITFHQAVQVIFGNYFLALLTPGATGGAVAQILFLRHAGVPTGKATVLVIVRALLSIFFLMLCMPFLLLSHQSILPGVSNVTLMGWTLASFIFFLIIVQGSEGGSLDNWVAWFAKRVRTDRRKKLIAFYHDIKLAVSLLSKSPGSMLIVFLESGMNLLCIYTVVPCLLLGLGVTDVDWFMVMGRMIFLNMILYFMPTPGGAGIAEGGFIYLFADLVPEGTVGIIAVCWRILAEYVPFFIGFYYTIMVFGRDFLKRKIVE